MRTQSPTTQSQPHHRTDSGSDQPIRVLIIDDHPAVRAGVAGVLAADPDIEPVAMVATAREALIEARRASLDVAIVDYHLPDRDGLSLALQLKALPDPSAVLIYSAFADARLRIGASVAGADALASKDCPAEELCATVREVAKGACSLPAVRAEVLSAVASRLEVEDLPILGMLINRIAPAEVAEVLGISSEWLEMRRWAILQRIASPDRHPDAGTSTRFRPLKAARNGTAAGPA
jgi:DNA-binding NarL/FixJ family response regulator